MLGKTLKKLHQLNAKFGEQIQLLTVNLWQRSHLLDLASLLLDSIRVSCATFIVIVCLDKGVLLE